MKGIQREQFHFKVRKNLYGFVHVQGMHTGVELVSVTEKSIACIEDSVPDLRAQVIQLTHDLQLKTVDIEEKKKLRATATTTVATKTSTTNLNSERITASSAANLRYGNTVTFSSSTSSCDPCS